MRDLLVGVVMGSESDRQTMQFAADVLTHFAVPYEFLVVSAHRTPHKMYEYAAQARGRLCAIIAGAGGAAHLPGMLAALTPVPVFGVPMESQSLRGIDSLLSIVQMPGGVPVATFGIGASGAKNAALHVIANLATGDERLARMLDNFRREAGQ